MHTNANGHALNGHPLNARALEMLPPELHAECALLGAILMDNKRMDAAAALLTSGDFAHPINGQIFVAALGSIRSGVRADPITIATRFAEADPIDIGDGNGIPISRYLRHLIVHACARESVGDYANVIIGLRRRRDFLMLCEAVREAALDRQTNIDILARQLVMDVESFASAGPSRLRPVTLQDLLTADLKPRDWIVEGLLAERSTAMFYAWRGGGKTWLALALGLAIAAGGPFLRWNVPRPCNVLYVDGEMPIIATRERLQPIAAGKLPCDRFRILSADQHEHGLPDLASYDGQAAVERALGDAKVVILDNISTLMRSGVENESESWLPVQQWLLKLRRRDISVILVHHANKGRAQRGTSRREDILDTVLNLRAPEDYDPTEGARFEVHFEKARGLHGPAVEPFEAKLDIIDGRAIWTTRDLGDAKADEIQELSAARQSIRKIAEATGMSKSAVQRALKKMGCPAVPHPSTGTAGQDRRITKKRL